MPKSRIKLKQFGVRVNGVLIRKSFASVMEARKWQRDQKQVQDETRSGSKRQMQPTLLSVGAADFLRTRLHQASFIHQEIWMGKYILTRPQFKDMYLHEITRPMWREVFGDKGELVTVHGLSAATHNRVRSMVRKMYEDARKLYEPPRALDNPVADIDALPEPKRKMPVLASSEEILRYLEAAYQDHCTGWGIYSMLKLNTGLRQSNIIALRWSDVDLTTKTLWVRLKKTRAKGIEPGTKKGADEQTLGINDALYEALIAHKSGTQFNAPEDWVVTHENGQPLMYWSIDDCHRRTTERARIPYLSEHKLRHTYATHFLRSGGSIYDLKMNLFHSSITVTEKYAQALPQDLSRRANQFQVSRPDETAVTKLKDFRKL